MGPSGRTVAVGSVVLLALLSAGGGALSVTHPPSRTGDLTAHDIPSYLNVRPVADTKPIAGAFPGCHGRTTVFTTDGRWDSNSLSSVVVFDTADECASSVHAYSIFEQVLRSYAPTRMTPIALSEVGDKAVAYDDHGAIVRVILVVWVSRTDVGLVVLQGPTTNAWIRRDQAVLLAQRQIART